MYKATHKDKHISKRVHTVDITHVSYLKFSQSDTIDPPAKKISWDEHGCWILITSNYF